MTSVALNNLWSYLQGLQLTQSNRKWLAERLVEPQTVAKNELDKSLDDIRAGRVISYHSLDDLIKDI